MDRRCRLAASLGGRVAAAAAAAVLAGCTMCPDPYDYSGPVPNGSSPQNDFRARSNGILPLGAAPCPWPQLVMSGSGGSKMIATALGRSDRGRQGEPTLADPAVETAAAAEEVGDSIDPQSVLVVVADSEPDSGDEASGTGEIITGPPELTRDASTLGEQSAVAVPLAETPGWRTRR